MLSMFMDIRPRLAIPTQTRLGLTVRPGLTLLMRIITICINGRVSGEDIPATRDTEAQRLN